MVIRKQGTRPHCGRQRSDVSPGLSIFVLVLLPDRGHKPEFEDHYPLSDPFYSCYEAPQCHCPLEAGSGRWKLEGVQAGGVFDGRLSHAAPLGIPRWRDDDERLWERNLVRPLDMRAPISAYAVITPDGLWHQCVVPEPQDLVVGSTQGVDWRDLVERGRNPTAVQVAWRFQIGELLMRYQHCWLLGLDGTLSQVPSRRCLAEDLEPPTGAPSLV
jgi:hypothetical protein